MSRWKYHLLEFSSYTILQLLLLLFFFFEKGEEVVNKYLFYLISFLVSVNYYITQRKVKQSNGNKYLLKQLDAQ